MGIRLKASLVAASLALLAVAPSAAHAAFPGTNGKIAFLRLQEPSLANTIETIEPDGTGEQSLINGAFAPAWSADGARIAFLQTSQSIEVANADGSAATPIKQFTGTEHGRNLSWSPDGQKIAFDKF